MPPNDRTDELFRALGDPTRRRIMDLLAEHETLTVSELHGYFPDLVRSGISKHLMALREAGLVYATRRGREQHYRIEPGAVGRGEGARGNAIHPGQLTPS
jgi:DNA-binding transcriptional ArsR family regulator